MKDDWWKEGLSDAEGTMLPEVFPVVMVTQEVHEMIRELEMAAGQCEICPKELMTEAYTHLNAARSELYRYLQTVERQAGKKLTHIKRF